jgi:hypothetical protein
MDETEDKPTPPVADLAATLRDAVGRLESLAGGGQAQAEAAERAETFARRLRTDPTVVYERSKPFDS